MNTREWLDSLSAEQRASFMRVGGVSFQIFMALLRENGFRIGVQSRYGFVENMVSEG